MVFVKLFIESTKPKVMAQKNLFYFLLGYFISIFFYLNFNIVKAVIGSMIFLFVYSCVYVVNDLFDYDNDRKHPIKKFRPIPSGRLNPNKALVTCGLIYIIGFILSFILINSLFALCILLLIFGNVIYSHPFFKTKKNIVTSGLLLGILQYLKLLAGWSLNAGEFSHPVIYFMIPACLYLYSTLQFAIHSEHYKGRFKIERKELIAGRVLMILPAVLITILLFTKLIFYITFTIVPIYFAFLYIVRKLKIKDSIKKINKYMTALNSLLISLNTIFYLAIF